MKYQGIRKIHESRFISLTGDADLVAGMPICAPVFVLSIAIGDIRGLGGSSLMSRLLGNKQDEAAGGVSAFCLYVSLGTGLAFMSMATATTCNR